MNLNFNKNSFEDYHTDIGSTKKLTEYKIKELMGS